MGEAADVTASRAARRERLVAAFRQRFGRTPEICAEAPGRVNLIGEHLDYNDGIVLPAAIDRSVMAASAPRDDDIVCVYSADFDASSEFKLTRPIAHDAEQPWADYVRGVFAELVRVGHRGRGLDIVVAGNVPEGAGLSSSAAIEMAVAGAVRAAWHLDLDDVRLALMAQRAENDFVGVRCGIMDQFCATLAVREHALLIDCRSLECETVPLRLEERGLALVVIDSGMPRHLADSEYNRRREECAQALALLRDEIPVQRLRALRDVSVADFEAHSAAMPETLRKRVHHVVTEQARVRDAVAALRDGALGRFGELMDASHASLRDDYEVSVPEIDWLVGLAQGLRGVLGARLTGAGFGGCTVNLVRADALDAFAEEVVAPYEAETGLHATLYVCRAADGLRIEELAT